MIATLFDKAPSGFFAFKEDSSILLVNDTLASILKYEKEDLAGQHVEKIFTIPTRIFFQTHFFPLVKMHGHAEEIFITLLTKDNQHLPVLLNAVRSSLEDQMIISCACIVVPNRKKFEDELVAARNAAEKALRENSELLKAKSELQQQAEKLEEQVRLVSKQNHELKQFSHVVTHNLREPLRKILLYTGRVESENETPAMAKLLRSTAQMKAVITGLQQYVWLNEKHNEFKQVDLNTIIRSAEEQVRQEKKEAVLELDCPKLPTIEGDPHQLKLLVYHLLSNSLKFKKAEKATLHIHFTILKQNKFQSVEEKYKYEDFIRLEFVDEGIGFDPVFSEHIFELFRKLDHAEGQGLGLALCKKVVENHSGSIEAESVINSFTKITIWLPLQQTPKAEPAAVLKESSGTEK